MHAPAPYALLDSNARRPDAQRNTHTRNVPGDSDRGAIVCASCAARITHANLRVAVAGQHQHTFFNPAGVIYRVACFAAAPGCSGIGAFSGEFSWFGGHRWQIAVCSTCAEHLGWHFEGDSTFSALITDRIRPLDA